MSATASVSFVFDGTRERLDQIYSTVCDVSRDVALDIGTFYEGTAGTIEFMVDDYAAFKERITCASTKTGISFASVNFLRGEENA